MGETWWFEGEHDPGRADLAALATLTRSFEDTAEAAGTARRDLAAIAGGLGDVWEGEPAREFAATVEDDVLRDLVSLEESYAEAAAGFSAYVAAVADIADRADALGVRIRAAQTRYETAVAALQAAVGGHGSVTGSTHAPAAGEGTCARALWTPPAVSAAAAGDPAVATAEAARADAARRAVDGAQAEVDDAWAAMQVLYRQMRDLAEHDRVAADSAVVAALGRASDVGIHNAGAWASFWKGVAVVAAVVAVVVLAVTVVVLAVAVVGALAALASGAGIAGGLAALLGTAGAGMAVGGTVTVGALTVSTGSVIAFGGALAAGLSLASHAALGTSTPTQVVLDTLGLVPLAGSAVRWAGLSRAGLAGDDALALQAARSTEKLDDAVNALPAPDTVPAPPSATGVGLYRADGRPADVVFETGFPAKGDATDLLRHALVNPPDSAYVSTTWSWDSVTAFAGDYGKDWIYTLPPEAIEGAWGPAGWVPNPGWVRHAG